MASALERGMALMARRMAGWGTCMAKTDRKKTDWLWK
jgi:hypothetical protein